MIEGNTEALHLPHSATRQFDAASGMFYVDYSGGPVDVQITEPTFDSAEIIGRFLAFVKGEAVAEAPKTFPHLDYDVRYDSNEYINELVIRQSEHLVYSGALDSVLTDPSLTAAEKLWELFRHKILGNVQNRKFAMPGWLPGRIADCRGNGLPLHFVLVAFPFKDQNPFRTVLKPYEIDLGEVVFLARLAALCLATWRMHPFGAKWLVLSDATLYAPIFDIPTATAERYVAAVDATIHRYNLQGMIQVVDLKKQATPHLARAGIDLDEVTARIRRELAARVDDEGGNEVSDAFLSLVRGQVQGLNLRKFTDQYGLDAVWHAVYRRGPWWTSGDTEPRNESLENEIHDLARRVALDYAATNIALGILGIVEHLVPGGLRTTVHAKAEQLTVPRLGRSYPWNGTAVLRYSEHPTLPEALSVQVMDISEFVDEGWRGVILPGNERPWYFERTD